MLFINLPQMKTKHDMKTLSMENKSLRRSNKMKSLYIFWKCSNRSQVEISNRHCHSCMLITSKNWNSTWSTLLIISMRRNFVLGFSIQCKDRQIWAISYEKLSPRHQKSFHWTEKFLSYCSERLKKRKSFRFSDFHSCITFYWLFLSFKIQIICLFFNLIKVFEKIIRRQW
jgi:hypothetical protein